MVNRFLLMCFIFISILCSAQNKRDKFITDSIINKSLGSKNLDKQKFESLLKNIEKLEKDYNTYEPRMRYQLLESAYNQGNMSFFKEQLSISVEKYGIQVPYMKENLAYFNAIMTGELSSWFKEMYLEKHLIWLKNNFDKQIDLKKLNGLHEIDQILIGFSSSLENRIELDTIQKKKKDELFSEYNLSNLSPIVALCQKLKTFPTDKSFAIIQNPFEMTVSNSMQSKYNFDRSYLLFFDYYKKAYLNNDMYYTCFSNIDYFCYIHHGYTKFGLLTTEKDIQEIFWKNIIPIERIPVEDVKFKNQIKKEFQWK